MAPAARGNIVFDLDGTLVDSVGVITAILNTMLSDCGAANTLTGEQVRPHVTTGGAATIEALLGGSCGETAVALAEFRARYAATTSPVDCVYPGVGEALETLASQGFVLSVFSNKTQALCDKVLTDVGLATFFKAIVGTGAGVPEKPDPTGYRVALARAGAPNLASCLVGDSQADAELAARAKVPFLFAAWGYGDAQAHQGAFATAWNFAEVPALVAGALASVGTA